MSLIAERISMLLADGKWIRAAVARARALTGGSNACAATLSQILLELKLIDKPYTWTQDLVGSEDEMGLLEKTYTMERILHPADIIPADIIASRDRPDDGNRAPDHVFTAVSYPEGPTANPFIRVVDNYCRNGQPYLRNLGSSGFYAGAWRNKTPMSYGLRFKSTEQPAAAAARARQELINALALAYKVAAAAEISQLTLHHLNSLRWSPELRDYDPEK